MKGSDIKNYWWYKVNNNRGSIDYIPYRAESREEANMKIAHDIKNKDKLYPFYFSSNKSYTRKTADIVSYKACNCSEVEFVARVKRKEAIHDN